jgi:murein DD-endopeptidase MepM/ murein hydrolase activator NlpD
VSIFGAMTGGRMIGVRGIVDLFLILSICFFYEHFENVNKQRYLMLETLEGIGGGHEIDSPTYQSKMDIENRIKWHGLTKYFWAYPEIAYPVADPSQAYITSEKGLRYIYGWEMHNGIDIVSRFDYRVFAGIDGTADIGHDRIYGDWVRIESGQLKVQYSHLGRIYIVPGRIKTGQIIGLIGNTGRTFGRPHLDFMIWENGRLVNPLGNSTYKKEVAN